MDKILETQQALKDGQQKATSEAAADKHAMELVEQFLLKHTDRVRQWMDANPGQRPPVFYDERQDRVIWLTRKQRRQSQRKRARGSSLQSAIREKMTAHAQMKAAHTPSNNRPAEPPKEVADEPTRENERQGPPEPVNAECAR